eukprot:Em0008g979a
MAEISAKQDTPVVSKTVPDFVETEYRDPQTGTLIRRTVYVTEVSGTRALDLYSGWDPVKSEPKFPLESLPTRIYSLVTLQRLWLSHNLLTAIPPEICSLVQLRELFLHCNRFEAFPAHVCKLSSLEILWLDSNQIKEIPGEIASLKSLCRLHLDKNSIESFPDQLCDLRNLEVLYLNDNHLTGISENVGSLKQLRRLYLHNNKITELPNGITQLHSLVLLNLEHNEIRHLSREFQIFQSQREAKEAVISVGHNPGVSVSAPKLKVFSTNTSRNSSRSRRHSDQVDNPIKVYTEQRKQRPSLPDQYTHRKLSMQF